MEFEIKTCTFRDNVIIVLSSKKFNPISHGFEVVKSSLFNESLNFTLFK